MYIRQQIEPAGISMGLGWLEGLAASPDSAEARRLKEEMTKPNVTREKVERSYWRWLEVRSEEDSEVYYLAAKAAGDMGCGTVRYLRLMKALGANPSQEMAATLTSEKQDMELGWAYADIRLRRNAKGDLQPVGGLPFAGHGRNAIERAQKELKEKGRFHNLLPAIAYTIDGHAVSLGPEFAIFRGVSVVDIDQKGDGSFQLRPKPGPWNYLRARDECPIAAR